MDFERPHHHRIPANNNNSNSNSASSELFICFSSRLSSSSSMKLSSKSILSPGRTDKQISLSASLSRRLRSNGSIKGGQSPMFPTGTKKRGCAFENTEPTSPKVTCIGQVRVKTKKKQAMKMRSMSKRRGSSGEASFRRIGEGQEEKNQQQQQQHSVLMLQRQQSQNHHLQQEGGLPQRNNQKWVHLPLTICEALRAFGAEFNCFLPCRSSCMSSSSDRESKEKMGGGSMDEREAAASARSCGAVFARWLVAMQEGEAEKGREIDLVVGGGGGEEEDTERRRSHHRRHVMEDIDINEVERCNNEEQFGVMEEEGNRVSICVPPKNALLLMRCRSDPVKMAALANRFWESPVTKDEEDDDREEEEQKPEGKEIEEVSVEGGLKTEHIMEDEKFEDLVALHEEKEEASLVMKEEEEDEEEFQEINLPPEEEHADNPEEEEEEEEWVEVMEGDELVSDSSIKALVDPENHEIEENKVELVSDSSIKEEDDENRDSLQSSCSVVSVQSEDGKTHEIEAEPEDSMEEEEEEAEKSKSEEETTVRLSEEETTVTMTSQRLEPETHEEDDLERESRHHHANLERESSVLPDCLLLMMCEPKLSMEVSKETWVCSTDFIRCIPSSEKKVVKTNGRDHPPKKKSTITTTDSNPPPHNILLQPPRSSISLPVAVASQKLSMASMIEQKLVSSVAYEPFVLTRCKSEPMRTATVKLKPEACFWNNRKLEPHHRGPAVGVGAAGVGF